jgi:hypothetical protein
MKTSIELIADERQRQVVLAWTPEHDDDHTDESLRVNAARLAVKGTDAVVIDQANRCVWNCVNEPDKVRQLVIAGALIAAEIDRLQRLAAKGGA